MLSGQLDTVQTSWAEEKTDLERDIWDSLTSVAYKWESWMRSQVENVQIVKRWQGKNPRDTATLGSQAEDDKLANELETSSQWVRKDVSYGR